MKVLLTLSLILLSFSLFAEKAWDLKQCIEYALEHNIQVKQAIINSENSHLQLKQSKNNRLPNLSAGVSDGFSFGRSESRLGVNVDQNSNSANASLNTDIPLFQGLRAHYDIAARKLDLMASIEDQNKIKNDIRLNITSFYLNALIQKELVKIAKFQVTLTDTLVVQTEIRVNNGKDPISKLYEIKAQQANEVYNLVNAEKNMRLALLDLAQLLELETIFDFDIEEPVFVQNIENTPIPKVLFEDAIVTLPDVKAEIYRLESSQKNVNMAKAAYYPSLSLGASTSTGVYYLYDNLVPNDPFGSQLGNNWRSYVGLSLNIPIFNRMSVKTNVSISKLDVKKQELQIENAKKTIFKDIQKAVLNAQVSKEKYVAAEKSAQANFEAFHFVEQSFAAGRATVFDLQQSRNNLEKSLSDQVQSKYEFIFNTKVLDFYNGVEISL